ncbi:hypothetical protein K432DRAFT_387804 [Lepidopterella palustris CBS 459.81]|uniref:Uncharacterized protein n=1 Tax=Lepidopterella palustris CBS 459.81 TaxID=1314670 RepID=A0A8E2JL67_9PEZI|nr:hypothetical protein K432DRAFT_387804 [Lepidopterella palustris CBS 459.81]
MFTTKPSLLAVRISSRNRRCPALRFPREQPGFLVAWQQLWLAHLSFTLARNALSKEMSSPSSPPLSFTSLAPSDSWRDADIGQSSYLGGDHNMDPAVVDSIACSHAKTYISLRIFFVTGNCGGQENQGLPAASHSDSRTLEGAAISLIIGSDGKLHAQDYFQSYDYQNMGGGDQDFDSGGLSLLDPTVLKGNGITRMALTSGKNGKIYISNADNLGGHRVFGGSGSYPLDSGYFYSTPVGQATLAYKLGLDGSGKPLLYVS